MKVRLLMILKKKNKLIIELEKKCKKFEGKCQRYKKKMEELDEYKGYKKKVDELEEYISNMQEADWKGDIIKEYEGDNGVMLYDMKWQSTKGLTMGDLTDLDMKKWEKKKKKRKRS
eukprot:834144_1